MTSQFPLGAALDTATEGLELTQAEPPAPQKSIAELRRARRQPSSRLSSFSLCDVDGVLRFETEVSARSTGARRRRRGPAVGLGGDVVRTFRFEDLPPNEIGRYLSALDRKLNPSDGLRQLAWTTKGASLIPVQSLTAGRTLLLIHGTFSKSEAMLDQFNGSEHGRAFLQEVLTRPRRTARYAQVLTFDHATVGVSPVINAFDLARATQGISGPIDVVCHSRGGLVARWWQTGFRQEFGDARTVFVGSPLAGTSLAAPPRLKASLEMLANIANVFTGVTSMASVAIPFLSVATGLMKVVSSVTSFSARTPMLDAVMAMIPGLLAQGRVGNNAELARLQRLVSAAPPNWFAVQSNFEPDPTGWKFWKRFVRLGTEVKDGLADAVFRDPNDLVVDSSSMTTLGDTVTIPAARTLNYRTSGLVHHCNYFEQPQTVKFLRDVLLTP